MGSRFIVRFHRIDSERTDIIAQPEGEEPCDGEFLQPYTPEQFEVILRVLELLNRDASTYLTREDKLILKGIQDSPEELPYWHAAQPLPDLPKRVGRRLYHALFAGDVGEAFRRQIFRERNALPINLSLQFKPDDPNSARYPWELMREDIDAAPLILSKVLLSRHFLTGDPLTKLAFSSPLQVLMTVARPQDTGPLVMSDRRIVERLLKSGNHLKLEISNPVYDSLLDKAIDIYPQIIHFDGHGVFGRFCPECELKGRQTFLEWWETRCSERSCEADVSDMPNEGFLIFENSVGKADYISADRLRDGFVGLKIKLFVLSACQTGTIAHSSVFKSAFDNVGPALVRAGIPAVIAMQFSVNAEQIGKFTGRLYKSLADGKAVEIAIMDACRMLPHQENFRPVLFLRDHLLASDFEDKPATTSRSSMPGNCENLKRRLEIAQRSLQVLEEQAAAVPFLERTVTLARKLEDQRMLVAELQNLVERFESGEAL